MYQMHRPVQGINRGRSGEGRRAHGRAVLSPQFSCKPKLRKSLSLEKGVGRKENPSTQRLVHAGLLVDVSSERAPVPFHCPGSDCVCVCSFRHLLDTLSDHLGIEGPLPSATALTRVLSTKGTSLQGSRWPWPFHTWASRALLYLEQPFPRAPPPVKLLLSSWGFCLGVTSSESLPCPSPPIPVPQSPGS